MTDLSTVEDVLSEMKEVDVEPEVDSDEARRTGSVAVKENVTGGKGKEKLTAKKRQRVL